MLLLLRMDFEYIQFLSADHILMKIKLKTVNQITQVFNDDLCVLFASFLYFVLGFYLSFAAASAKERYTYKIHKYRHFL